MIKKLIVAMILLSSSVFAADNKYVAGITFNGIEAGYKFNKNFSANLYAIPFKSGGVQTEGRLFYTSNEYDYYSECKFYIFAGSNSTASYIFGLGISKDYKAGPTVRLGLNLLNLKTISEDSYGLMPNIEFEWTL